MSSEWKDHWILSGAEGFDFMQKHWPDARRDWTPAQRCWIIAAWDALGELPQCNRPAWFMLPGGQGEPNMLDLVATGQGEQVVEYAKRGYWL